MLPLLRLAADDRDHTLSDAAEKLAHLFRLTPDEVAELLPSGRYPRFRQRVGWAKTYLNKAQLLEYGERGSFTIADRGRALLAEQPERIDIRFLMRYPEFKAFREASRSSKESTVDDSPAAEAAQTPEELLEDSYERLRLRLAEELLSRVHQITPTRFESVVLDLLLAMGYGGSRPDAGRAIGRSGDGGIDGLINEDPLGLDVVYIQAKRWEGSVGRPTVQAFVGSLEGHRARKGVLITTSSFTGDATQYVGMIDKKVILIDGTKLAQLMIEHGVGVTVEQTYALKRLDLDYFDEQES